MGRAMDGQVLYWVAAYLVDGLLIDTGCRHTAEDLLDYLQHRPIREVYISHYHEDHIGGCALLQHKLNLKIWAQPCSIPLINSAPRLYPYQELVWGYPEPTEVRALPGNELQTKHYSFQVVETPGHSADHSALIEPSKGWCFSGDLFVSEKIKVLRPEEDISAIMRSMQKLLDFDLPREQELVLFTSIGKIVLQGKTALKSCLVYLENLGREVKQLYRDEGLIEEQIVERLFGGESTMAELTNGQFASVHLIRSLLKSESLDLELS
ncbi:MAG: MBL fold metallo-hydrolase [Clostridia bacterium]|nr:MBL fold metallo-hydrolase [Clostridia bacterium]